VSKKKKKKKNHKNWEVTSFVSEIKVVKNYPDFEKLADGIKHSLRGL